MKYLRNFPDAATRDAVLASIDYGVLSYTEGVGIKMKTGGSVEEVYLHFDTHGSGIFDYTMNYDGNLTPNDISNEYTSINPTLSECTFTSIERNGEMIDLPDTWSRDWTLNELGALPNDTLVFEGPVF